MLLFMHDVAFLSEIAISCSHAPASPTMTKLHSSTVELTVIPLLVDFRRAAPNAGNSVSYIQRSRAGIYEECGEDSPRNQGCTMCFAA